MASADDDPVAQAWALCYLDPVRAGAIGRAVAAAGGAAAPDGWLHVALAESRVGESALASAALQQARRGYAARDDAHGLAYCDEVQAILLRRAGDCAAAAQLQSALDARSGFERDAMHRFIGHNSRAITAKLLGRHDDALRHFYAAMDWAARSGWPGPRITALSNLGGYHQDLYNLEDAQRLTEQALSLARETGARQVIATAATNLIIIYHAAGELQQARAMVEFLTTHTQDLLPGALQRYATTLAMGHLAAGEIDAALAYLQPGAITSGADGDGKTQWAWLQARCLLAQHNPSGARAVAEQTVQLRQSHQLSDQPYDMMALHRVLADACEAEGDAVAALRYMRQAHALYEHLVGRSARARYIALQVAHELAEAQRERDLAMDSQRSVEDDRRRLTELNAALQAQAAETEMLHTKLREQALRDPLTGLHNRRYLFEIAPGMLELARRQGSSGVRGADGPGPLQAAERHLSATHAGDHVLQRFSALLSADPAPQRCRRAATVARSSLP